MPIYDICLIWFPSNLALNTSMRGDEFPSVSLKVIRLSPSRTLRLLCREPCKASRTYAQGESTIAKYDWIRLRPIWCLNFGLSVIFGSMQSIPRILRFSCWGQLLLIWKVESGTSRVPPFVPKQTLPYGRKVGGRCTWRGASDKWSSYCQVPPR